MKFIKNSLLIIISLIFIELFSQLIFLFYGEQNKYSIFLKPFANQISEKITEYQIHWDYSTNKMKPGYYTTDKGINYKINSKGFRGDEFNIEKEKIRILSFGGSTTIGLESPDNKTYPYQLQNLLNSENIKFEVINMGFGSKSLNFIKNLYFNEAFKYEPDLIIIYNNRNSLMYDSSYINPNLSNVRLIKINYFLQENIMTFRLMLKIYKRVINLNLSKETLKSPWGSKGIPKEYLLYDYKNSLIEIINFSLKNNVKVVLTKQAYNIKPNIFLDLNKYTVNQLIEMYNNDSVKNEYNLNEKEVYWLILGTILNKKMEELNNYKNVILVDPVKELLKDKSNFTDIIHLTPRGNSVLAKEIFKEIFDIF
jgi:lysophospholipase L1-like esterase|tara:strand:- start:144 stop:1244 length:1101 start_codon:yes stop_codon:yes gene_type:complete